MLIRRLMFATGVSVLLLSATVFAAETDPQTEAAARALFERADAEMAEGKFADACPRFEEVRQLMTEHINTGIKLADCYVGLNRTASAWNELSRVRSLAVQQENADKVALIDERLAQVMPKVPHLRVEVPSAVASIEGISIQRGDIELGAGQWGLDLPLDPGTYTVRATAPGRKPWKQQVEVNLPDSIGEKSPVVVKVGELVMEVSATDKQPPAAPGSSQSGLRIGGIIGVSVGTAGLVAGAILGGVAISRYGSANEGHCLANNHCDQVGYDLRNEGISLAQASTGVFVVSGVLAATGVVLWVISPKKRDEAGAGQTSVWMGPGSVGLRGSW